jgi:hypothetical protein
MNKHGNKHSTRDFLKYGLALLFWFSLFLAGGALGIRAFFSLHLRAGSDLQVIPIALLLLLCGGGGVLLGTIAWMLIMRPFLTEDEMRILLFSAGGEIPLLTRFLRKMVEVLY